MKYIVGQDGCPKCTLARMDHPDYEYVDYEDIAKHPRRDDIMAGFMCDGDGTFPVIFEA